MPSDQMAPSGGARAGGRHANVSRETWVSDTPVGDEVARDARRRAKLQGVAFDRPARTRIVTVANQKGGVGKTTTAVNLAAALAIGGCRVLVVDCDPQGNASTALGIELRPDSATVYDVLLDGRAMIEVMAACPEVDGLWCVPATIDLSGAEIELVAMAGREHLLDRALEQLRVDWHLRGERQLDYILIDCPPSLGLLTLNAFVAGREVLIPIQCEYYALEGLSQLIQTVNLIRDSLNPELQLSTILLTMFDQRTKLAHDVVNEVRQHFPAQVLDPPIPRSVRVSEAPGYGQTVLTYDPSSSGALAYLEAAKELTKRTVHQPFEGASHG